MNALASPARPQASSSSAAALGSSTDSPIRPGATLPNDASQQTQSQQRDLWSSILNSVKSSKAISTKNIILIGEPKSGKTSLLSALASTSPYGLVSGTSSFPSPTPAPTAASTAPTISKLTTTAEDLGLAYAYFDVGDEKDRDEIVARVGAYTLHSSEPAYTSLLPFAFPEPNSSSSERDTSAIMASLASTTLSSSAAVTTSSNSSTFSTKPSIGSLRDSVVVIVLDWEQPWTFLEQLRNWLSILSELVDVAADGAATAQQDRDAKWSSTRAALDEMKEQLEAYIRAYVEPQKASESSTSLTLVNRTNGSSAAQEASTSSDAFATPVTTVSGLLDAADANPLTEGTLTDNLGIPIVVVCAKSDAIPRLERDKQFKEEQFDYIQQVLRTVCMKYGAALFYTSSLRAQSIDILRSYLLHRLFTPVQAQADGISGGVAADGAGAGGAGAVFGFAYRASTTDRDTLLVPAGWDSWGKIRALRETFDCAGMAKGWENDCEIERLRRTRKLARSREVEEELEKEMRMERGEGEEVQSAMKLYEDIVSDWEAVVSGKDGGSKVRVPDEQAFLGAHHATLQKDPDAKSRFSKRAVVGPMTGSSAGLPSVEKLMEREARSDGTAAGQVEAPRSRPDVSRRESTSAAAAAAVAAMTGGAGGQGASRPTSPAVGSGATSPGAPKQSEVLHSFFQSLLKDKAGGGVGSPKVDRKRETGRRADAK